MFKYIDVSDISKPQILIYLGDVDQTVCTLACSAVERE